MNSKSTIRFILVITLISLIAVSLTCCRRGSTPPEEVGEVTIASTEGCNYTIVYSSADIETGTWANKLKSTLRTSLGIDVDVVSDGNAEVEHEILIGSTSRSLSAELLATATEDTAADSWVWGLAYKDGRLAIYANCKGAYGLALKQLTENYLKDGTLTVPTDLWQTKEYTKAERDADEAADEQAKKEQEEADKLKALDERLVAVKQAIADADFYNSQFGATDDWQTRYAMPTDVFEPERQITAEHPRVHLTSSTVPKIKALFESEEYIDMASQFWKLADSEGFTGAFPETYHKNGERCRYSEEVLAQIEARALAYLITGHKAYGYEAIFGIKNAMLTLLYTVEDHGDVYHGPSHVMFVLAEVYDWCYDLLTQQDKKHLISGCVYLLIEAEHFTDDDFVLDSNKPSVKASSGQASYGLEYNFPPDNMNAVAGHGTGPQFLRDYMMVTCAFADEMPSWWDYVGGRFYQEYVPVTEKIYQNGYVTQGTANYGTIKILVNLIPAYLVELSTGENPFPSYVAQSSGFMLSHLLPNGRMFETGDGHRTGEGVKVIYDYFYYYAALYDDTFSLQAAKYFSEGYTKFSTDSIYTVSATLALALCAECDVASGNFPSDMPLYTYAGYPGGQTVARNSWGDDAAVVMMKIGELTNANHDHLDSGTFQIYYKGLLATTSGQYHHYGATHHLYYHQSTVSTNGILVYNPSLKDTCDGWYSGSQTNLPTPNNPERIVEWQSGKYDIGKVTGVENSAGKYSYLAGDITNAYNEETVDYVGRRMLTVFSESTDAPVVLFIYDSITSDKGSFRKTFLLHTVTEPTLGNNESDIKILPDADGRMMATVVNGDGALVLQNVYGGDKMFKIGGEGYAYWIGNENDFDGTAASGKNLTDDYVTSDSNEPIWGRIEVVAQGERHTDMLNVMYVTDKGNTELIPAKLIESSDGKLLGATIKDMTAMFFTDASRSSDVLTFTTEGTGTMRYYVSGLYEGMWSVSVNGSTPRNIKVKEESGMLSFTAECGTVTLTPGDNIVPAGYGRIDYVMSGGTLPDGAPEWYEIGKTTPLPIPSHGTGYFEGWYSDINFTNKVTEIPEDATGTFKVYAKFYTYDVYADLDYSRENEVMLLLQKDKSNGVEATATLSVDKSNGCLVWNIDSGTTKVFRRNTPLISDMDVSDNSLTYVITMSKQPGVPLIKSEYQLRVADSILQTSYGYVNVMCTSSDGGIYLGANSTNESMRFATLSDSGEALTVKLVIDFDGAEAGKATVTAYNSENEELATTKLSVPTKAQSSGITSMLEWRDWLKTYQIWWVGYGSGQRSSLRIHSIYGIEGNHVTASVPTGHGAIKYELGGGTLPDGAPLSYEMGKVTALPTPTHESGAFRGWFLDSAYTQPITEISAVTTGEVTVYAKWGLIFVKEDYSDGLPSVNVTENNYSDGQIDYRASGKTGASFIVKSRGDGTSYLEWTKGEKDSFICATNTSQSFAHLTGDAVVSMTFDLELVGDAPFICADAKILASSNQGGGEDCIFQIKSNGDICLNNSTNNVIANISTDKRVVVRIAVDFKNEIYTAYDEDGKVITSCAMKLPQKAKDQGFTSFDEWRKSKLTQYLCYIQARTSADGAKLGINSILIEEGNSFAK